MTENTTDYDAVVIGLGFAGIYQLHKLRDELGLRVRAFEKGSGVGGTWFWNRYPGAMSDTESPFYRYSFDEELLNEWDWHKKYIEQPDILAYLEEVVRRHDLMKDIQLNTEITGLEFDENRALWTVRSADGRQWTARYVVTALIRRHGPRAARGDEHAGHQGHQRLRRPPRPHFPVALRSLD
jgi:cation diffusion facilitator CzcD-associated flavoprotein CzcO